MTVRQRILTALDMNPEGLSKGRLRRAADCNTGAFRRVLNSLIDQGIIEVAEEDRPDCGPTKIHRLA